jgi:hypothetical protein
MKSFSQSFSGSQDRLMAQEKSILKIVTSISSPKCELDVIKYDLSNLDYKSKQAIHVAKSK